MKGETDGDRGHGRAWVGRTGRRGIEQRPKKCEQGPIDATSDIQA